MAIPQLGHSVVAWDGMGRQRQWRGTRVGAVALAAAMLVACGSSGKDERTLDVSGERVATSTLREIVDGLCAARGRASEDRQAARTAFFGRVHEPIHTLAKAVQVTDRRAAGDLLRAKQAVEADFADPAGDGDLEGNLERLVEETIRALKVVDIGAKSCPA